jgi:hypothetical protein
MRRGSSPDKDIKSMHTEPPSVANDYNELLIHLGEDGFNQMWNTLLDLKRIASQRRYILDLHSQNFMLGSDGHIVISDPFFAGD